MSTAFDPFDFSSSSKDDDDDLIRKIMAEHTNGNPNKRKAQQAPSPVLSDDEDASAPSPATIMCVPCADQSGGSREFACDLCDYKCKRADNLKTHMAFKHDIGVVWHFCDHPGCKYQCKRACDLGNHKARMHNINVVWYVCDQTGCDFKSKQAGGLKMHKAHVHNIDVVWHVCDHPGCKYKCKRAAALKQHKADRHDIGVTWHFCDQPGCDYKAKRPECLKPHKAYVHDIDVVWHKCDADPDKCKLEFKQLSTLYVHIQRVHARVYAQRKKEQEERVRRVLLDAGWEEWRLAESMPPIGAFRREKRIDFKCAKLETRTKDARIDFVLGVPNGFVFLEVDEQQHKYGYDGLVSCDMKRMSHVMESLAVETNCNLPCIYWLRYNPHEWHVDGALRRMPKVDREARLVAWLGAFEGIAPLRIGYAFYDCADNGGALDVLDNPEYNAEYKEVVDNLMDLAIVEEE